MSDGSVQRVVIQSPDPTAPAGHDAAMIALVDKANGVPQPDATPERPTWLPEKFKTVEELAASYKELEARQGGQTTPPADPAKPAPTETPPADPAAPKGVDMAALSAEFAKDGKLSDTSYATLKAAGFDQATVDAYIQGQTAIQTQRVADIQSAMPGGQERYGEMIEWAKANLSDAEKTAFNNAMGSSDVNAAKLAVHGLGNRFMEAVGREPALQGGRVTQAAGDVYESIAQMKADMANPLYRNDPAFRSKVQAKLGRSNIM